MTEQRNETCGDDTIGAAARSWGGNGIGSYVFPAFWLVYLAQTADGVSKHSHGAAAVVGYLLIVAFAAVYLIALQLGFGQRRPAFWALYAVALALTTVECFFAHADALVFLVYVAVLTVATRARPALVLVLALTAVTGALPAVVPGWGGTIAWNSALTVLLVSLAMWGFFQIIRQNAALTAARAEVARLAAENERSRIARDLHDLLGHSLTTITVKAGLARRLAETGDTARAHGEIAAVEQLSRRTLGDVRAAVSGQHEVTLAGELATAREVLLAAGIDASLPASVAEADPLLSELFGWALREGITNVVRHSRAAHVTVTLAPHELTITDDGRGAGSAGPGNGLRGLGRRAEESGATLRFTSGRSGSRLSVVASPAPRAAGTASPPELAAR
jgi:two-component system sensor histidine kinase DesK